MQTPQPAISVLMPVYNAGPFLERAVRSILNQTFRDFELIIVNDGSKDDSPRVLERLAAEDSRIRLISRENRGLIVSLNEMIAAARAPLLARMDGDDIALPERFALQVAYMARHPEIVAVGTGHLYIDEHDQPIDGVVGPCDHWSIEQLCLRGRIPICHPSVMMRAEAIRAIGGYRREAEMSEDLDLFQRLSEVGKLANMPQILVHYRQLSTSLSGDKQAAHLAMKQKLCHEAAARRGMPVIFDGGDPWRPSNTPESRYEFAIRYGWAAWRNRYFRTALSYVNRAVRIKPFKPQAWLLLKQLVRDTIFGVDPEPVISKPPPPVRDDKHVPLVSVVMPVYNSAKYLRRAVDTILQQTWGDFELVLIDDGSKDESLAIMREYEAADPRVRVTSRPNKGISLTRNEGTQLARGKYIAIADSDDVYTPNRLYNAVEFLETHPDYVAVGGKVLLADDDGDPICPLHTFRPDHEAIDQAHLEGHSGAICHPASMVRRDALIAIGGYDPALKISHDLDVFFRLMKHGKLGNVEEVAAFYRQHAASICNSKPQLLLDEVDAVVMAERKRRGITTPYVNPARADTGRPQTIDAVEARWAWSALHHKFVRTARKLAWHNLKRRPASPAAWKLMLCTLRGH
jgi:glycosyltransferase involved in cell wall biosynthesis